MRTIKREIVSALIYSQDNKIFMGRKDPAKGGVYSDCWHLPGGGVDRGENKMAALRREILEETGIDINGQEVQLASDDDYGEAEKALKDTGEKVNCRMHFNVYRVNLDQPAKDIKIILSDDLIEFSWFSENDLSQTKLTPPSVKLFSKLRIMN